MYTYTKSCTSYYSNKTVYNLFNSTKVIKNKQNLAAYNIVTVWLKLNMYWMNLTSVFEYAWRSWRLARASLAIELMQPGGAEYAGEWIGDIIRGSRGRWKRETGKRANGLVVESRWILNNRHTSRWYFKTDDCCWVSFTKRLNRQMKDNGIKRLTIC